MNDRKTIVFWAVVAIGIGGMVGGGIEEIAQIRTFTGQEKPTVIT